MTILRSLVGIAAAFFLDVTYAASPALGNEALIRYLGEPVAAPSGLSAKYNRDGIETAFRELCGRFGAEIEKLDVDASEFPFIVIGRLKGGREFIAKIDSHLKATPGYAYGGSVVGMSNGVTFFSVSVTPASEYPREHAEIIRRRLLVRLGMLADQMKK